MASTSNSNGGANAFLQEPSEQPQRPEERLVHRIFVGPMPERVISHTEAQTSQKKKLTLGSVFSLALDPERASAGGDKTEEVARLVKAHAFRFFLHEGGDEADWDSLQEESTVDELMKRWKDSEWGRLWSHRHDHRRKREGFQTVGPTPQWFGTSFEVGKFLGVDVLHGQDHIHARSAQTDEAVAPPVSAVSSRNFPPSTFRTGATSSKESRYESVLTSPETDEGLRDDLTTDDPTPASSMIGLLRPDATSSSYQNQKSKSQPNLPIPPPPGGINRTQSEIHPGAMVKGKAKMVHYEVAPIDEVNLASSSEQPVPPEQVLKRDKSSLAKNTSSAAAVEAELPADRPVCFPEATPLVNDIVLRDRMLVRVSYIKEEGITHFDEAINRTTRDLKYEDWGEFIVAWRKDSIEIYRDHNTPGKEWMTGHKRLSYVIPLTSTKTKLSLFSFVDLTFCITCAPTTTRLNPEISRWVFSREKEGTNIFIFKVKSRSRAYDWIWKLWRSMGGKLPTAVDVYNPRLDIKVTIDIPETDPKTQSCPLFSRKSVIQICMDSLQGLPDWKYLVDEQLKMGHSLELAWRSLANLDWVWLESDVTGKPRDWHVLCGLPLRHLASKPPSLEIRIAPHEFTNLRLKNGKRLEEPPSIEGYLDRIRPNTQTKQSTYLAVHQGYIYFLNSSNPHPPMPPGLNSIGTESLDYQIQNLRQSEIRRGMTQITSAMAMLDLRAIVAVRRASHPTPPHVHDYKADQDEDSFVANFTSAEPTTEEDVEDTGGEEWLGKLHDRSKARMRRSFELLLKTGHVIRFEAYSCRVAVEWIVRLRALILYWKHRHRMDAQQEIELAQAHKPRLTPQTRAHCYNHDEEQPSDFASDLSAPFAAMDSLYNWCILEDCKPLVKGGRLYMRKGLRGQYKLVQLCLIAGHLVRFRINGNSSFYPVMRKKFNLLDAYVCSGYLAEQCLPKGQYNPNATPAPRRYQDGLETDDREEDMMFMIWYRSQPQMFDADQKPTTAPVPSGSVPGISAKNKVLIFKTRSIFERDAWCWAINSEIEKIVRAQGAREDKLRETGNLVSLTK